MASARSGRLAGSEVAQQVCSVEVDDVGAYRSSHCSRTQGEHTANRSQSATLVIPTVRTTLEIHPVMSDAGIIATQKIVSPPLSRLMNTGSPCTEDHNYLTEDMGPLPELPGVETRLVTFAAAAGAPRHADSTVCSRSQ
jgi:hypothetical protein